MRKPLFAALFAVASLSFTPKEEVMPDPNLSIVPNPMKAEGTAKIFGPAGKVVSFSWNPSGAGVATVTIGDNGEVEFNVPAGTGSLVASATGCISAAATFGPDP